MLYHMKGNYAFKTFLNWLIFYKKTKHTLTNVFSFMDPSNICNTKQLKVVKSLNYLSGK